MASATQTIKLIKELTSSVNGRLVDSAIRHALYLEHYKAKQSKRILDYFHKYLIPDLIRKTKRQLYSVEGMLEKIQKAKSLGLPFPHKTGEWTLQQLERKLASTFAAFQTGVKLAGKDVVENLSPLALSEAKWQRTILDNVLPKGMNYTPFMPSMAVLDQEIISRPFKGKSLGKWFDDLSFNQYRHLNRAIKRGVLNGESIPQIVKNIKKVAKTAGRHATTITRTAVNHITSEAREATYLANSEVLAGWQFVATLDSRTTDICMSEDGKVYKFGEGGGSRPPLHHQCRSTTAPVVKTWEELGLDKYGLKNIDMNQRAALGGPVEKVPYPEWIKAQPLKMKQLAMGKKWGLRFHNGEVTFDQYLRRKGGKPPKPDFINKPLKPTKPTLPKTSALKELSESKKAIAAAAAKQAEEQAAAAYKASLAMQKKVQEEYDKALAEAKQKAAEKAKAIEIEAKRKAAELAKQKALEEAAKKRAEFEKLAPGGIDSSKWINVGAQKGSNPGGFYQAPDGTKWYVKTPATAEHARNEVLAAQLYEALGVNVPEVRLTVHEGQVSVASRVVQGLKPDHALITGKLEAGLAAEIHGNFAADAFLANWDVVGLNYDNLLILEKGAKKTAYRIDAGGALRFRAKGKIKGAAFGESVQEIDTLRGIGSYNPQAKSVFGKMDDAAVVKSMEKVAKLDPKKIDALVDQFGPVDQVEREKLRKILQARRKDIIQRKATLEAKIAEKAADEKATEFLAKLEHLTPPPDSPTIPALEAFIEKQKKDWKGAELSLGEKKGLDLYYQKLEAKLAKAKAKLEATPIEQLTIGEKAQKLGLTTEQWLKLDDDLVVLKNEIKDINSQIATTGSLSEKQALTKLKQQKQKKASAIRKKLGITRKKSAPKVAGGADGDFAWYQDETIPYAERYSHWVSHLSQQERTAFNAWTGSTAKYSAMRKHQFAGGGSQQSIRHLKLITAALERGPRYRGTLYRGISVRDEYMSQWQVGKIYRQKTHDCYSKLQAKARTFGNYGGPGRTKVFLILEDSHSAVDVHKISRIYSEAECIVRQGHEFLIKSIKEEMIGGEYRTVVRMVELD